MAHRFMPGRRGAAFGCIPAAALLLLLSPRAGSAEPALPEVQEVVSAANRMMVDGKYVAAIDTLETTIKSARQNLSRLREAYIVLVRAHLAYANTFKDSNDDKEAAFWEGRAREKALECLMTPELRHVRPMPGEDFYAELDAVFTKVRSEHFGSLEISELSPPDALVILDGDTLRSRVGEALLEEDIPIGDRQFVIKAEGYNTLTPTLHVLPGTRHIQSYELEEKKGVFWYASRGAVAVAAVVTGGLLLGGNDSPAAEPEPLPGPPAPP